MPYGYTGKILWVDLKEEKIKEEIIAENIYREFLGGTGLGVRMIYERMKPKSDPLGPGNILGFVTGPLTATLVPGSGRFTVVTKSPVTGGWADSSSGGFWGPNLKWAGYDAIFFTGISRKPVYLVISNGNVELREASKLWGKDTYDTEDYIEKELGKSKWRISCIGPAGEACSLIAGIVNEKGRIAARGGVGAVMGSKKLKAIVLNEEDKREIPIADKKGLDSIRKKFIEDIKANGFHQGLAKNGTGGGTSFLVSIGDCPTKNWNSTGLDSMPSCEKLNSMNMERYKLKGYGCHSCPLRCGAIIKIEKGPFKTKGEMHRPEYETLASLGTLCLNDNIEAVIKANEICNLYGMDTIAVGGIVAFAMECYEKGIINIEDTGGIDLKWGNGEAVVALTEKIAKREGIGNILADGVKKASEHIGKGAEKLAMHIGGHRIPYHDPRLSPALGTHYIADSQPACHMGSQGADLLDKGLPLGEDPLLESPKFSVYGDYDKKGLTYAKGYEYFQLVSSGGLCALYTIQFAIPIVELIRPVTGWNIDWNEGLKIGKRILTLRQAFNAREGIKPSDFKFPERLTKPMSIGMAAGIRVDFDTLKKGYFEAMGWNIDDGKPRRETLKELGIDKLTEDLWL